MSDKHRGLGRGLSALLGEQTTVQTPNATVTKTEGQSATKGISEIPIEHLVRNADQPRRLFTEADIDDLAASVKEKGVLQPILVRSAPGQAGKYQIIAGERRWRAAQMAGLHTVPIIVREMDDLEVLEVAIVENVQRADLNPIEEARAYRVLMDRFGRTQEALSQVVSKSRSHIANILRLLTLPDSIQEHVLHGRLSAGHARALVTADNPEFLADKIIKDGLSVRQTEALLKTDTAKSNQPNGAKSSAARSADNSALEQDLAQALGVKVTLDDRGGRGDLRLSYSQLEQLDEICRRLLGRA
jgi:ParB family chromosome partitioning protein